MHRKNVAGTVSPGSNSRETPYLSVILPAPYPAFFEGASYSLLCFKHMTLIEAVKHYTLDSPPNLSQYEPTRASGIFVLKTEGTVLCSLMEKLRCVLESCSQPSVLPWKMVWSRREWGQAIRFHSSLGQLHC